MSAFGNFTIRVFQEEDGSYYAEVVNLPGCFTMGKTLPELGKNLKEAIASYLSSIKKELSEYQFHITPKDILHTKAHA